jgi:micrococcal nuclease
MSWRSTAGWITLIAVIAVIAIRSIMGDETDTEPPASQSEPSAARTLGGTVPRIVDGDTIKVELGDGELETVRYIGVDTPETVKPGEPVQCFGKAASAYNRRLVEGKRVRLQLGREQRDRYGRLLAYVFVRPGGAFVNALLVARGYARALTIPPNDLFANRFKRLARQAERRGLGLWSAC